MCLLRHGGWNGTMREEFPCALPMNRKNSRSGARFITASLRLANLTLQFLGHIETRKTRTILRDFQLAHHLRITSIRS